MYNLKFLKFVTLLVYLTYARPRHSNSHRTTTHDENANFEIFLDQHPNLKHHHLISQKPQVRDTFADLRKK